MKIIFIFLLLGFGYLLWSLLPVVSGMRYCYQTNRQDFDEISILTKSRGWNERSICEAKYQTLARLETCLDESWSTSSIAQQYFYDILLKIRKTTQPFEPDIGMQQQVFNNECEQYEDLYIDIRQP